MSRRPLAAAAVLLLWFAVLTVAFHGYGRLGCGGSLVRRRTGNPVAVPARKMLLAVTSLDAASPPTGHHHHRQQHHHQQQHHRHRHRHHRVGRWNWQGIPPSAGNGEEVDPRYGVQKRLVPTGPNPLHH